LAAVLTVHFPRVSCYSVVPFELGIDTCSIITSA